MKTTILAVLFALMVSTVYADCESERYDYGRARSAYNKLVMVLLPKIKAGKKLTKKEQKRLDKANMLVYTTKIQYEACVNSSGDGNNYGGVDY